MMAADPAAELRARFMRGFPAIALVIFLSAVDQTIVATALADIATDMGGIERVSWIAFSRPPSVEERQLGMEALQQLDCW